MQEVVISQEQARAIAQSPRYQRSKRFKVSDIKKQLSRVAEYYEYLLKIQRKMGNTRQEYTIRIGDNNYAFGRSHFNALRDNVKKELTGISDMYKQGRRTRTYGARMNNGFSMPVMIRDNLANFFRRANQLQRLGKAYLQPGFELLGDSIGFIFDTSTNVTSSSQVTSLFALYMKFAQLYKYTRGVASGRGDHYGADPLITEYLSGYYNAVNAQRQQKYQEDVRDYVNLFKSGVWNKDQISSPDTEITFLKRIGNVNAQGVQVDAARRIMELKNQNKPLGSKSRITLEQAARMINTTPGRFEPTDMRFSDFQTFSSLGRSKPSEVRTSNPKLYEEMYPNKVAARKAKWKELTPAIGAVIFGELDRVRAVNEDYNKAFKRGEGQIPASEPYDYRKVDAQIKQVLEGNVDDAQYWSNAMLLRARLEFEQSITSRTSDVRGLMSAKYDSPQDPDGLNAIFRLAGFQPREIQ